MRSQKTLALIWLILGSAYLYRSFDLIYQFSRPGVFWLYMFPSWIAFSKVFFGLCCVLEAILLFRDAHIKYILLLPLAVVVQVYLLIDFIKFLQFFDLNVDDIFFSMLQEIIFDSAENFFLLALIGITTRRMLNEFKAWLPEGLRSPRLTWMIGITIVGVSPYILDRWLTYDLFQFLH